MWDQLPQFQPDCLFFDFAPGSFSPCTYCQVLRRLRRALSNFDVEASPDSHTLHSMKVTALSGMSQLSLDAHARTLQGKHKASSCQLYSRDDIGPTLLVQDAYLQALAKGWLPVTPVARGAQRPIPSKPLSLALPEVTEASEHPAFSYFLAHDMHVPKPPAGESVSVAPAKTVRPAPEENDVPMLVQPCVRVERSDGIVPEAFQESEEEPEAAPVLDTVPDECLWVRSPAGIYHLQATMQ